MPRHFGSADALDRELADAARELKRTPDHLYDLASPTSVGCARNGRPSWTPWRRPRAVAGRAKEDGRTSRPGRPGARLAVTGGPCVRRAKGRAARPRRTSGADRPLLRPGSGTENHAKFLTRGVIR